MSSKEVVAKIHAPLFEKGKIVFLGKDVGNSFSDPVRTLASGGGFTLYCEKTDEKRKPQYLLSVGEVENPITPKKTEADIKGTDYIMGKVVLMDISALIVSLIFIISMFSWTLLSIFLIGHGLAFWGIKAILKNHFKNSDELEKFNKSQSIDPAFLGKTVIVNEWFAKALKSFMHDSGDIHDDFGIILSVLSSKIEAAQSAEEIEHWLSIVEKILTIDDSFPKNVIPTMSVDASEVLEKLNHSESVNNSKDLNDQIVDDSKILLTGAMSYLGANQLALDNSTVLW